MKKILIILMLLVLVGCTTTTQTASTTQKKVTTTSMASTTTISTSTTSTTSTTTTTFRVPKDDMICSFAYDINLNDICGVTEGLSFYVLTPQVVECTLGVKIDGEDVAYMNVKDYNRPPYVGVDPLKMPIFGLSRNIGVDEVGEKSARFYNNKLNEVQFVEKGYLVTVQTWDEGNNKPILCDSEQTLDLAKRFHSNLVKIIE